MLAKSRLLQVFPVTPTSSADMYYCTCCLTPQMCGIENNRAKNGVILSYGWESKQWVGRAYSMHLYGTRIWSDDVRIHLSNAVRTLRPGDVEKPFENVIRRLSVSFRRVFLRYIPFSGLEYSQSLASLASSCTRPDSVFGCRYSPAVLQYTPGVSQALHAHSLTTPSAENLYHHDHTDTTTICDYSTTLSTSRPTFCCSCGGRDRKRCIFVIPFP